MWLNRLRQLTREIPVGIIGAGAMGKGLYFQCSRTPGIQCSVLADIDISRAIEAVEWVGRPYRIVENAAELNDAILQGVTAITDDGHLVSQCDQIDVLLESTSSITEGGQFAEEALLSGKHLILMNAEIDLLFGPYLHRLAQENGVVMASCDGDQHGVIKRLHDEMTLWGFEPVMAGNIKGYLDLYSNPTAIIPEADKRNLDYRMATAYTDGSKLAIEMALVSNALDFAPSVSGMVGPTARHVSEVLDLFDFDALREMERPVVDYILGAEPGGGVFCVGYCDDKYQMDMMTYYKMGDGPYYVFYRPYHLCHVEAMQCIAEAVLDNTSLLRPDYGFKASVNSFAKKNMKAGDRLDGLGGYTCYGLIESTTADSLDTDLPICLADDVILKRDIALGEKIGLGDVVFEPGNRALAMYEKAVGHSLSGVLQSDLT
jgi:predicted homoserine dehydrogenase-like protein